MKKFGGNFLFLIICAVVTTVVFYSYVYAEWPFKPERTEIRNFSTPAIADINNDGKLEIIVSASSDAAFSNATPFYALYCLNIKGEVLWSRYGIVSGSRYKSGFISSPTAADLNNDGNKEILIATADNYLYCLNNKNEVLWKHEIGEYTPGFPFPVAVDLDNDGNLEVLMSSSQNPGKLYCLNKSGNLVWENTSYTQRLNSPAVADLGKDNNLEILVTGGSEASYRALYCLNSSGIRQWVFMANDQILCQPVIGDLNNGGSMEILIRDRMGFLYCVDKIGRLLWQKFVGFHSVSSAPALADINKDGNLEIIVAGGGITNATQDRRMLYCLSNKGEILWNYDLDDTSGGTFSPVIADLNNDGNREILVGAGIGPSAHMYCLDKNGQLIWKYQVANTISCSPAVADLDGNGGLEVLFADSTQLYCLNKYGKLYAPKQPESPKDLNPWPMERQNLRHTGAYAQDYTAPTTPKVTDEGEYTSHKGYLYANWFSEDPESGIREYRYMITERKINLPPVRDWTFTGVSNYVTAGALNLTNGKKYYFAVQARNNAGLWSDIGYSDGITVDTVAPYGGSIKIANFSPFAKLKTVWLNMNIPDAESGMGPGAQMQFSNDGITYSNPEPYRSFKLWALDSDSGARTVYIKFKDVAGNWSRVYRVIFTSNPATYIVGVPGPEKDPPVLIPSWDVTRPVKTSTRAALNRLQGFMGGSPFLKPVITKSSNTTVFKGGLLGAHFSGPKQKSR